MVTVAARREESRVETRPVRITRRMQSFCHAVDCAYPWECPRNHSTACSAKLDLNTAIVWEASRIIESAMNKVVTLRDALYRISILGAPLYLHKDAYSVECNLMFEADRILREYALETFGKPRESDMFREGY